LVANCRFSLAMADSDLGAPQNQKAVAAALEIVETLGQPAEQDIAGEPMSAAANRVSAVSLRVGDFQQSLRFAEMSTQAAAAEPPGPESTLMRGVALRNAAMALSGLHQYEKAKENLSASIALLRELSAQQPDDVQSRAFLAQALIERAMMPGAESRMRDLSQARAILQELIDGSRYPMARSLLARALAEEANARDVPAAACELRRKAVEQLDRMAAEGLILPAETAFANQLRSQLCGR
jgi:tetratricopeptide (TPR) repeat protein